MKKEEKKQYKERVAEWKAKTAKFLDKFGLKDETKLLAWGKVLIFAMLLFEAGLIIIQLFNAKADVWRVLAAAGLLVGLLASEGITLFIAKRTAFKVVCYIVSVLCIFTLVGLTGSQYIPMLYILALTEFYLSAKKVRASIIVFCIGAPLYAAAYALTLSLLQSEAAPLSIMLPQLFEALVYLTVHFIVINFLIGFYRQYLRLTQALKDLDESNARLQEAYDELAEVTALEERQRIAKDIHDTAGHSITTVIMQTEAAKLILDQDPQSAKQKIVAANLQAKHALEELRESVHLLSGNHNKPALKTALLQIVAESTDGTDVVIRQDIDDVEVDDNTYRYLCNTLKEGIANGLRHGGANAFYFELKTTDDGLVFLLSDNGVGRESGKLKKGFGLSGMVREAKALGGTIAFYTEPDEGFEIRLTLPLRQEQLKREGDYED